MSHLVLLNLHYCQHQGTPWCDLEAKQTYFVSDTGNNVNGLHTSLLVLMPTAYHAKLQQRNKSLRRYALIKESLGQTRQCLFVWPAMMILY